MKNKKIRWESRKGIQVKKKIYLPLKLIYRTYHKYSLLYIYNMKQESQLVVAIKNGTVIDHIPSAKLFEVVNLLHLQDVRDSAIIVGYNLKSKKFGHKSLIKVFDKFFTDAELNQLSVVAPNVTLCIIRDYEVVEKKSVTLPEELRGIVRCNNPKCITNNEPMQTVFHVSDRENGLLRCHYCGKEQHVEDVKVIE